MVYHPGGTLPGYNLVGVFNDEGPPVPIPNTEVKLISAENTCLATDRENRSTPTSSLQLPLRAFFFFRATIICTPLIHRRLYVIILPAVFVIIRFP